MRSVTATATQIITSDTRQVDWVTDLFYDGQRRLQNVAVTDVELSWDANNQVAGTGRLTVLGTDPFGNQLTPSEVSDSFAPYGAELQVDVVVSAGAFSERVALGRYVIESVPTATSQPFTFRGRTVYPGEAFDVELRDLLFRPSRNKFVAPEAPHSTSAWSEASRLTGLPVQRNVPDGVVPPTVVYDGERLDSLDDVFDTMQAWPQLTSTGLLTARPYAWGASLGAVSRPDVVEHQLRSDNVYNRVVVEGKGPAGDIVRAVADIVVGPLRTLNTGGAPSPYGVVPYFYSSDFITDSFQAEQAAQARLALVSRRHGVTRQFSEPLDPRRELGDVLTLAGDRVRVSQLRFSNGTSDVTVEVEE